MEPTIAWVCVTQFVAMHGMLHIGYFESNFQCLFGTILSTIFLTLCSLCTKSYECVLVSVVLTGAGVKTVNVIGLL